MIDFHAHILPHADHGSDSSATSVAQLRLAHAAGVTQIVATPHFYPSHHHIERFLERRDNCAQRLRSVEGGDLLPFRLGAEVLLCPGLERMAGIEKLCIEGTKTMLLELPFNEITSSMLETTVALTQEIGLKVVLAHVDRYNLADVKRFLPYVAGVQLNADALASLLGFRKCVSYLQSGQVVAIGSDVHRADGKHYKDYAKAVRRLGKETDVIMQKTAELLL